MLHRLITLINVSIAVSLLLIGGVIYWFALRPLPKVSGTLGAPVAHPAVIKRDSRGVPHLEAGSFADVCFLQGFATAQDRLWQMDGLRRFGGGELSEVFGRGTLQQDLLSRRMRLRALAQQDWEQLASPLKPLFERYAEGVNFYIERTRGNYPLEYRLPGHQYEPKRWTPVDSLLVGLVMFRDLTDNINFDLFRGALLGNGANMSKVHTLFPATEGLGVSPGSNAWAVSGKHSSDGSPLLANDPHLSYGIPPTWHLVHLKAPGLNVSGATLPGLPGVVTGHNEQIAWGVTNLQTDVLDLYQETLDERTGRYQFGGQTLQAQRLQDTIRIKGEKDLSMTMWLTRHGPVIGRAGKVPLSMRWTASEGLTYPFWDIDRAHTWQEFRSALRTFWGPAQNFVYADRAGHIGYQAAGRVPIRKDFDGDVPLDGASGHFEWSGYIPFEQMASVYDPPSGIIATANQNPFPPQFPFRITGTFADPYRVRQIRARLAATPALSVEDMLAIQKDVYSSYDRFLAGEIETALLPVSNRSKLEGEALAALRSWQGQMERSEPAPVITQLTSSEMSRALIAACFDSTSINGPTQTRSDGRLRSLVLGSFVPRPFIIETLLRRHPAGWVPADDWNRWIRSMLDAALDEARKRLGTSVKQWRWGQILQWKFAHPIGKQLPLVDRFFDIGPVEMSGSGSTVKQTTATLGPSERMIVDLGNLDRSVQNLTTGESGQVASGHYKDQWPGYYVGKSSPMQFDSVDAKETLHVVPLPNRSARQ